MKKNPNRSKNNNNYTLQINKHSKMTCLFFSFSAFHRDSKFHKFLVLFVVIDDLGVESPLILGEITIFVFTRSVCIDSLVTKILKIKMIKQHNTGHKTYIRHILFTENYIHRLNIKYI